MIQERERGIEIEEVSMVEYIWTYCDTNVCFGRISLKILVSESNEMWKYLKSESAMVFADPFMRW